MVLHQTRVGNAQRAGGDSNTATGFLKHNGEDEAVVDSGSGGDGLDGIVDGCDFGGGVIGKRVLVT